MKQTNFGPTLLLRSPGWPSILGFLQQIELVDFIPTPWLFVARESRNGFLSRGDKKRGSTATFMNDQLRECEWKEGILWSTLTADRSTTESVDDFITIWINLELSCEQEFFEALLIELELAAAMGIQRIGGNHTTRSEHIKESAPWCRSYIISSEGNWHFISINYFPLLKYISFHFISLWLFHFIHLWIPKQRLRNKANVNRAWDCRPFFVKGEHLIQTQVKMRETLPLLNF